MDAGGGDAALAVTGKAQLPDANPVDLPSVDPVVGSGYITVLDLQAYLGGVSRASIYRWIAADLLPAPVRLGPKRVGFSRDELREKLSKRPRALPRKMQRAADQAA